MPTKSKAPPIQSLVFKQHLTVPLSEAYRMFTNSTALREWLAHLVLAQPQKGGRLYLWWNGGDYATGEFVTAEANKKVTWLWRGRRDPGATRVAITFAAKEGGTLISLKHSGLGSGPAWAKTFKNLQRLWTRGLENLQSVLETGQDQRFTLRPLVGLTGASEMTPDLAARLGLPAATCGLKLDGVAEGMAAQQAGLQKGDVLIGLAGHKLYGWQTYIDVMQEHRAGDLLKAEFYRAKKKHTVTLSLSRRPIPEVPLDAAALAQAARAKYDQNIVDLTQCFAGLTAAEENYRPSPREWNVKEIMAHFIISERELVSTITEMIDGNEGLFDAFGDNNPVRHRATAEAYGSLAALLEELKCHQAETVAMLEALPPEVTARRSVLWRIGLQTLNLADHVQEHLPQIRETIAVARKSL